MKKCLLFLLLVVYTISTGGMTLHHHVCMGKESGISLVSRQDKDCPQCGMAESSKKGCCGETTETFKVKDDHSASQWSHVIALPLTHLPQPEEHFAVAPYKLGNGNSALTPVKPPGRPLQRLAQLMVFRI
ncbi:MAG: hypothetical protein EAZ62_06040 [Sphingobacteriia bacterium]|nr:MAG: hypothetical protein EAZ62_06040 [Sphingobacteriia bacterium]